METYVNAKFIARREESTSHTDTLHDYENVVIQQQPREAGKEPQTKELNKKPRSTATRRKAVVFALVVFVLLAVSVAALVVSFLQPFTNQSTRLIESLQQELETLKTRLAQSERNLETLSATCQKLGSGLQTVINQEAVNDQKISTIEVRLVAVNSSVAVINTYVQRMNNKVNENNQNISRYHPQDPKCLLSEYHQSPYFNGCYRVVNVSKTWADARDYCTASGEYLATFVTADSVEWFASMRAEDVWGIGQSQLWVGGYKYSSGWKWTGRVTVPFNSALWASSQPDSDNCMYNGWALPYNRFYDQPCGNRKHFMCETA